MSPQELRERADNPADYGAALSAMLFASPVAVAAFAEMRAITLAATPHLRVRLSLPPALHALRWELLIDPCSGRSLALDGNLHLSRYLSADDFTPIQLRPRGDLRALIAVADPADAELYGLAPIKADAEVTRATTALGLLPSTAIRATLPALAPGFVPVPQRWKVERTLGWLNHFRVLSKDYEFSPQASAAWVLVASIRLMLARLRRTATAP